MQAAKGRRRGSKTYLQQYMRNTTGRKKCQVLSTPSVARTTNTSRYQSCHFIDQFHLCRSRHKHIRILVISLYHSVLLSYPAQQHINTLVLYPCRDQLRHCTWPAFRTLLLSAFSISIPVLFSIIWIHPVDSIMLLFALEFMNFKSAKFH